MALRNILEDGDPILRKTCREVDQVTERTQMILDDMVETMRQAQGVGLAAPQVGIVRRMFVAEPQPGELYYFVNPEIVSKEGLQESEEGCLSVPGLYGTGGSSGKDRDQRSGPGGKSAGVCAGRVPGHRYVS